MHLRLVVDGALDAAWNMAADEAALVLGEGASLRLYGWSPHAVSLGYFQRLGDFADLPPGTALVRRLTGGGAIHHGDEITFALTADAATLPSDAAACYRRLHDAAIAALARVGVEARRVADGAPCSACPGDRWCFAAPGRDDVVVTTGKLIGSAQRRTLRPRARVLHHGSIVLRRPALTPFVGAIEDTASPDATFTERLRTALVERFAAALGMEPEPGSPTAAERALAARLAVERYRDPGFLARR